jgi:hypothetical protein
VGGSAQVHDDCWTGLEMKVASSKGLERSVQVQDAREASNPKILKPPKTGRAVALNPLNPRGFSYHQ